jgi:hypothetical protein
MRLLKKGQPGKLFYQGKIYEVEQTWIKVVNWSCGWCMVFFIVVLSRFLFTKDADFIRRLHGFLQSHF